MPQEDKQTFEINYGRCKERLTWAITRLGGVAEPEQVAATAKLIIESMSGTWRLFHTPEHIFEVGENGDAIEVLSALFHDSIYVQVDLGVGVNVAEKIVPYVRETEKHLTILDAGELPADPTFAMVMMVFGFEPGQQLMPTKGQNEFLSAVVAAKCLADMLPQVVLAQIAACIEATIPFRPPSPAGESPAQRLHTRVTRVNEAFGYGWTAAEVVSVVQRAIRLANRDVENFSNPSSAEFLDNTWNLMPETNHDLIGSYSYTVSGYRTSLQKMEGFLSFLKPERVFQTYMEEPSAVTYQALLQRTGKNLEVARLYLGSKLLSIAVVEALSQRLGVDIPLATMMGELPQRGLPYAQVENFLPKLTPYIVPDTALEIEVLNLLENGRTKSSNYDVKNSPVATFIIKSIGFTSAQQLLVHAKRFFAQQLSAEEFLALCDKHIVEAIIASVIKVFEMRWAAISESSS